MKNFIKEWGLVILVASTCLCLLNLGLRLIIHHTQPEQQEIKVDSVVVLDEEGVMMYCNPMDIIINGKVTRVDTIWIKYEDVSETGFKIIKSKVSGINTKDIKPYK